MKQTLPMLLLVAAIITSCKKSSNDKPAQANLAVLLTKIIYNTAGQPGYGKSFVEFTYNGKKLTKEVRFYYNADGSLKNTLTDVFNYNSQGSLTGTTITDSNPSDFISYVSSDIVANGNNVTEYKLYEPNNVMYEDRTLTYNQDGSLASTTTTNGDGTDTYSYNSSGDNTERHTDVSLPNTAFDNKHNLTSALPYWAYFAYIQFPDGPYQGIPLYPGTNNVINFNEGEAGTYSYEYNSLGYPSVSTSTFKQNGSPMSFQYQYTQVN